MADAKTKLDVWNIDYIEEDNMVYKKLKCKEAEFTNHSYWEEVPDEDLWEDGELESLDVKNKIYLAVVKLGNWKLIRRKDD